MKKAKKVLSTVSLALSLSLLGGCNLKPSDPTYTITWKNGDVVLEVDENVKKGEMPSYDGAVPTKEASVDKVYAFSGWSPEVVAVTADATYYAQFSSETRKYEITWNDDDDSLLKTESVAYGVVPSYGEPAPTKESDGTYTYTFAGWTPTVVAVTGPATYTATYSQTMIQKSVTYMFGVKTLKTETVDINSTITYVPEEDHYEFKGWYKDAALETAWKSTDTVTTDLILYAKMECTKVNYQYKNLGAHHIDCTAILTGEGLLVEYIAKEGADTLAYGMNLSVPEGTYSILLYQNACVAKQVYGDWNWVQRLPADVNATTLRTVEGEYTISTIYFSNETLGITNETLSISILFYEWVPTGGSQYGVYNVQMVNGVEARIDGPTTGFVTVVLREAPPEQTLASAIFEPFGSNQSVPSVRQTDKGIYVKIAKYNEETFGYGIMLGNFTTELGFCDLFATLGTVDHHEYGDWGWAGNYVQPSSLGIVTSVTVEQDNSKTFEAFYSYEYLETYLITAATKSFGFQIFEYVGGTKYASQANAYGVYICMNVSGTPAPFDGGVATFQAVTQTDQQVLKK